MKRTITRVVLTVSLLLLAGCQQGNESRPDAAGTSGSSSESTSEAGNPVEPTSTAPTESPALVENPKRKNGTYDTGVRESLGGIVSWEVLTTPKLDKRLGASLGRKADAFLTDHMLREDRWTGSHVVKAGEMDALADKVAPALYDTIEKSVAFFDDVRRETHGDERKMTAQQKKQAPAHADVVGHFILNGSTIEGGKGQIRNELTRKVVWVQTSGDNKGLINTWVSVRTRRTNNTGTGKELAVWQAWKQVAGKWTIVDSGWKTL